MVRLVEGVLAMVDMLSGMLWNVSVAAWSELMVGAMYAIPEESTLSQGKKSV